MHTHTHMDMDMDIGMPASAWEACCVPRAMAQVWSPWLRRWSVQTEGRDELVLRLQMPPINGLEGIKPPRTVRNGPSTIPNTSRPLWNPSSREGFSDRYLINSAPSQGIMSPGLSRLTPYGPSKGSGGPEVRNSPSLAPTKDDVTIPRPVSSPHQSLSVAGSHHGERSQRVHTARGGGGRHMFEGFTGWG